MYYDNVKFRCIKFGAFLCTIGEIVGQLITVLLILVSFGLAVVLVIYMMSLAMLANVFVFTIVVALAIITLLYLFVPWERFKNEA